MKKHFFYLFVIFLVIITLKISGNQQLDSLSNELKTFKNDSISSKLHYQIAKKLSRRQSDSAYFHFNKAYEFFQKAAYKNRRETEAAIVSDMGNNFIYMGKYELAREKYFYILDTIRAIGNSEKEASICSNVGITYWYQGIFDSALVYILKASKIAEANGNMQQLSATYISMGNLLANMNNLEDAKKYYQQAIKIKEEFFPYDESAMARGNLGGVLVKLHEYDEGEKYLKESLEIYTRLNNKRGMSRCLINLGIMYEEQNRYKENIEILEKALSLKRDARDKGGLIITLNNLGNMYNRLIDTLKQSSTSNPKVISDYAKKAIEYSTESYKLTKETKDFDNEATANKVLMFAYSHLGNSEKAFEHALNYILIREDLISEDKTKALAEMQTKYETEKKEQENTLLKKDNELNQKTIYAIGIFALLVIALAIVFFRGRQKQKMINTELEDKNNLISDQKEEIEAQANTLKEALDKLQELDQFKESMTSMIVHDLKNPLNSILNVPSSYSESKKLEYIKQNGKRMLNLVMNILDVNKFENANITLDLAEHTIFDTANSAVEQINLLAEEKDITLLNNIPAGLTAHIDNEMIQRVMVNLLTNAVKYTPVNGKILLDSNVLDEQKVRISVTDNGSGIPTDKLSSVFDKFGQVEARKSGEVRSTGIGLTFCKMAVEAHKGTIGVESKEGKGTTFWFELDYSSFSNELSSTNTIQLSENIFILDEESKLSLLNTVASLKDVPFFEISTIRKILSHVNNTHPDKALKWKELVLTSARNGNEQKFNDLLELINE